LIDLIYILFPVLFFWGLVIPDVMLLKTKLSYRTQKLFVAKGISLANSVIFFTHKIYHYR